MSTEDLIRRLAQSPAARAHSEWTLAVAGGAGLAIASALFLLITGVRPDLAGAWAPTMLKCALGLTAALALYPFLRRAVRPNVRLRDTLVPAALVATVATIVVAIGLLSVPANLRWVLWTGGGLPDCLIRIPLIALPIAAVLFVAARRMAPTRLGFAGAALGAAAGALAAIPYSFFCPIDSAPYVATWYSVSVLICASLGALAGRTLRW